MTSTSPMIFDSTFIADPFPIYQHLRESAPVHRVSTPEGAPVWLVTRYDDVRAGLADQRLSLNKKNSRGQGYTGFSLPPELDANLLNLDHPDHTRLRRLASAAFTRPTMMELRTTTQTIVDQLIDEFIWQGHADLIESFAVPFPITIIALLLGVPVAQLKDFRTWTNALIAPKPGQSPTAREAVASMRCFLVDLIAEKRKRPQEDLISAFTLARDEKDQLLENELLSLVFLILWAGYENSVNLIGNSMLALVDNPQQLDLMKQYPASGVEELIRYADPNQFAIRRFPLKDIEVAGVTIPAGDTVLLGIASANRDPRQFSHPDVLDLTRDASDHLSFGYGPHRSFGAPLVQLEIEVGIGTLLRRLSDLTVPAAMDELEWRPSFRCRGLSKLPVTFTIPEKMR